jgi:non-ribosomal peptide synthetase component F
MTTTGATNSSEHWTKSEQALLQAGAVFGPRTDYPPRCLHERVEQHAASFPHAPAILFEGEDRQVVHLSYGSLNRRANALAHALQTEWNIRPGDLVGVCLEPSLAGIIAFLALGKVGAAPYLLDPEFPPARLAFLLADAGCRLLLTHRFPAGASPMTRFPQQESEWSGGSLLVLHDRLLERERTENPHGSAGLDSLAYVIATSGSTGVPKAVPIRQRGLVNYLAALATLLGVQPAERVLNVFSLHFDAAIEQIALPLFAGATLCMGTRTLLSSGPTILSFLERHRIAHAAFTPSLLATLPAAELPELRSVVCGGERCWFPSSHAVSSSVAR